MEEINEIQGQDGLYKIKKIKILYEAGITGNLMYLKNLENNEIIVRKMEESDE